MLMKLIRVRPGLGMEFGHDRRPILLRRNDQTTPLPRQLPVLRTRCHELQIVLQSLPPLAGQGLSGRRFNDFVAGRIPWTVGSHLRRVAGSRQVGVAIARRSGGRRAQWCLRREFQVLNHQVVCSASKHMVVLLNRIRAAGSCFGLGGRARTVSCCCRGPGPAHLSARSERQEWQRFRRRVRVSG
ncbi:hypothetical protein BC828DRAFT_389720 [Blastocladiella britannica]|nr:hypothetical protein BC828DRAFT_389720 [Blastocladiella britannica]